jgi:hypothetical protein
VPAPARAPAVVLRPTQDAGRDRTADIQRAIDDLPTEGGTIQLEAGIYTLSSQPINVLRSNVVLQGDTQSPTTFRIAGSTTRSVLQIGSEEAAKAEVKGRCPVSNVYLPAGATVVHVEAPDRFKVGQQIAIERLASRREPSGRASDFSLSGFEGMDREVRRS